MADSNLHKVTVNLIPNAYAAVEHAAQTMGHSKSDTINRAVQAYDWFLCEKAKGNRIVVIAPDGLGERIEFL